MLLNKIPKTCKGCNREYYRTFCKGYGFDKTPFKECMLKKDNRYMIKCRIFALLCSGVAIYKCFLAGVPILLAVPTSALIFCIANLPSIFGRSLLEDGGFKEPKTD